MESLAQHLWRSECHVAVMACLVTLPPNLYYAAVVPGPFNYSCISHSKYTLGEELIKKMYPSCARLRWKGGQGRGTVSSHSHILRPAVLALQALS